MSKIKSQGFQGMGKYRIFQSNHLAILVGLFFIALSFAMSELVFGWLNRNQNHSHSDYFVHFDENLPKIDSLGELEIPSSYRERKQIPPEKRLTHIPGGSEKVDGSLKYQNGFWTLSSGIKKNVKTRSVLRLKDSGQIIYDVEYSSDEYGRRVTPGQSGNRSHHMLFMGCSFTFGEGLNDDETMPYQVAKRSTSFRVYNSAQPGGSVASLLRKARSGDLWQGINEKSGYGIYVFFSDHLRRVVGPMSVVATWGGHLPYFFEDENGKIVDGGDFNSGRPRLSFFFKLIWPLQIRKYFSLDIPHRYSSEHINLFMKMLVELKQLYLTQFPAQKFVFVFHPTGPDSQYFKPHLDQAGIHYIDYVGFYPSFYAPIKSAIDYDGHPSAATNELFAEQLVRDLNLDGKPDLEVSQKANDLPRNVLSQ